jgi:two-component system, OmpR family, sensor histidine kinase MtrB
VRRQYGDDVTWEVIVMRLRSFFLIGTGLMALLGLGAAGSLFWMSTLLQRQTDSLIESIERVRAAQELEFALFTLQVVHDVADNQLAGVGPPVSVDEAKLQVPKRLRQVEHYTETAQEQALVATARSRVELYLQASARERPDRLREAVAATDAVIASSISRSHAVGTEVRRVRSTARRLGVLLAVSVLLGVALVLFSSRARIYLPLLSIRHALAAFKSGQREWRVDQAGPNELRELATEFNDMAETLVGQDARQLQFLAGVAHDLRNPLHALKLSAQILLRAPTLPPPEKVRESLVRVSTQIDRLDRMVGDLLDRTRIEAGNLELRLEECDLRGLVAEVVELHRPSSEEHRLELTLPETPISVRCDSTRLTQVLTNLLSNALKYSPQGGRVQVRLEQSAHEVVLSVSDEGVGIPPDEYGRIFEPFKRSRTSSTGIPGIGLGLSVSRRLVRAHGGDIEVESQVGAGSIFRVRLPLLPPHP